MNDKLKKGIDLGYRILLSAMLVITGILMMVACVGIYRSGDKPFSPEAVAAAFRGIAIPVYLCLLLIAGSFLLNWLPALLSRLWIPRKQENSHKPSRKAPPQKQYAAILKKLHEKLDLSLCESTLRTSILAEKKKRRTDRLITLSLLVIGSIVFLCYGMNPANFHQTEISASMEKAMYVLLPCMAVPFGYGIFAAYREKHSLQREIALVREALSANPQPLPQKALQPKKSRLPWLSYGVLLLAVVFLLYGFFAGGTKDVLTKAVNICTECVGLG